MERVTECLLHALDSLRGVALRSRYLSHPNLFIAHLLRPYLEVKICLTSLSISGSLSISLSLTYFQCQFSGLRAFIPNSELRQRYPFTWSTFSRSSYDTDLFELRAIYDSDIP